MRIGFVTRLLWGRYGGFWTRLLEAAGAETVVPEQANVQVASDDPRLDAVVGLAFRQAAAEALSLADCDRIVVPALNRGYEGSRGSAQDPFVGDFPAALAQVVPGLPTLIGVPADLSDPSIEGLAIEVLSMLAPSHGTVRRVWQTHRADARPPRAPGLPSVSGSNTVRTVALVGQPWHFGERVRTPSPGPGERLWLADRIDPTELRREGWRFDEKLAPTDAEALGAVRRFSRRPEVDAVRMIVDPSSWADAWLERRARAVVHGRFETAEVPGAAVPISEDAGG